jgi:RNA polymerase sigma factor (sigma-70 family)
MYSKDTEPGSISNDWYFSGSNSKYNYESLSDDKIWRKFKLGDEGAFVYIYEKYFDGLVIFSYQFTQDRELIKDTIQDLFIYLRDKRSNLSDTNSIKRYLYKSCRNNLIRSLKQMHVNEPLADLEKGFFLPTGSSEDNLINQQVLKTKERSLKNAIANLSVREREIIYLFYFENLDYQQIAELIGYQEVKSVRSLLYKAIKKLRKLITPFFLLFYSFYLF